ncbi:MAG: aminotransferase class III-fold pyridoxal phosphate-dependent enzyme [Candidatus Omnitrophota bacterium]
MAPLVESIMVPLRTDLHWKNRPPRAASQGAHFSFSVRARNTGREKWRDGDSEIMRSVMIGGAFYRGGQRIAYLEGWGKLPQPLAPGEEAIVEIKTNASALPEGRYILRVDAVKLGVGFFEDFGSPPLEWEIEIAAPDESEALWSRALPRCVNLWTPSQGARRGLKNLYPLFAVRSDKARIISSDGREYLDYIMGWGSAVLGYNRLEIQEAIRECISVGPTLPLPHPFQVEVAEKLAAFIPCAERTLFGKNGSDVMEAAIRIARAYTGRRLVLYCGYHGFHDWYVAGIGGVKGIPNEMRSLVQPFPFGDLDALKRLLDAHRNEIAAVALEPCSLDYPPEGYLETVRAWTREAGIVLIFDEIMSAFRLANGGAQEKYGVLPDMAAVGKGMANGFPLAALTGPRSIMDSAFDIGYGPTFQGEVYSLAAAMAALDIYAREPVCETVCALGETLREGVLSAAKHHEIQLKWKGIAPRLVIEFQSAGDYTSAMLRTFFIQELLEEGILFGGTFLPSLAHTKEDVKWTLDIIDSIFQRMRKALDEKNLLEKLYIPIHVLYLGEKD